MPLSAEHRVRLYRVNASIVASLILGDRRGYRVFPSLPDDAEVVSVHHDPVTASFNFHVRSETFAPVCEGECLTPTGVLFQHIPEPLPAQETERAPKRKVRLYRIKGARDLMRPERAVAFRMLRAAIPAASRVVEVTYEPQEGSWDFLVASEAFPAVTAPDRPHATIVVESDVHPGLDDGLSEYLDPAKLDSIIDEIFDFGR